MYNEITTVAATAAELVRVMDGYCGGSGDNYELIFSDDGSTDGTFEAIPNADAVGARYGTIVPIRTSANYGKGAAVRRAAIASTGDVVLYTDCDLAYGTDSVIDAVNVMKAEGCDMLAGSRAIHPDGYKNYTKMRKFASRTYIKILNLITGLNVTDSQCGFKVFRKKLAHRIFPLAETNGWAFDLELFLLAKREGALVKEFPVSVINHRESRINMLKDSVKMLREMIVIKNRVKNLDR